MPTDIFPAQYAVLSSTALAVRLERDYTLTPPVTCHLQKMGNDDYLVTTGDTVFVLRVYAKSQIAHTAFVALAELLRDLVQAGLPVLEPVRSTTGSYVLEFNSIEGRRYGVLYRYASGSPPGWRLDEHQAFLYGTVVARIHTWGDLYQPTYGRWQLDLAFLLDTPLSIIAPFLTHRPDDLRYLQQVAQHLKHQLGTLPTDDAAYGLCHGDLHKMNLLIDDRQHVTVIDWDCAGYGWRAYDLAVLRWSLGPAMGLGGSNERPTEPVYAAYLAGYQRARPLRPIELAAIPSFVAVRIIWVAGDEIGQTLDRGWGTRWINDAYFDTWIGVLKRWLTDQCPFSPEPVS